MDLYQQNILDYYKHPRCQGELVGANMHAEAANALCGDRVLLHLLVKAESVVKAAWQGDGCVLSLAAADILTAHLVGKTWSELHLIDKEWLLKKLGVKPSPSRLRCAILPLEALDKLLSKNI